MTGYTSLDEQLRFAARHGDRPSFERLGGTPQQWAVMSAAIGKRPLPYRRGIV